MQPELAEVLRVLCMPMPCFQAFAASVMRWRAGVAAPCSSGRACTMSAKFRERWLQLALTILAARRDAIELLENLLSMVQVRCE